MPRWRKRSQKSVLEVFEVNVLSFQGACVKNVTLNRPICRATHDMMLGPNPAAITLSYGHRGKRADLHELLRKKIHVIPPVTASVTGAASHTPVMPNSTGSTNTHARSTTSPLENDMTADSNALPVAVK